MCVLNDTRLNEQDRRFAALNDQVAMRVGNDNRPNDRRRNEN